MLLSLSALLVHVAAAANCDGQLGKLGTLAAEAVGPAYVELARCDRKVAEANFNRYLERATDADAAVALFAGAVDAEVWQPVWNALGKMKSYEARDEVARRIGESCAAKPNVATFLQGAYESPLRDIEFQQWDDAYSACESETLWAWMDKKVATPPPKLFDEKFNALMGIYVKRRHADALPALTTGAVAAANGGGPFDAILAKMVDAVAPDLGSSTSPEDQVKLESSMVSVATQVPVEQARRVAGQLANAGADAAAAKLLPTLFPDRVQGGGGFVYGAAAIETGECDGKKEAFIHHALVSDAGTRWTILGDIEAQLRGVKPKLGKGCVVEGGWPVLSTPEPMKTPKEIDAWVESLKAQWEKDGFAVKAQKEKPIALP